MRMSDLQDKDIINLIDGKKIGRIIDAVIDDNGSIKSFIIQKNKFLNIANSEEEVKWNKIKTIGSDVILVDKHLK